MLSVSCHDDSFFGSSTQGELDVFYSCCDIMWLIDGTCIMFYQNLLSCTYKWSCFSLSSFTKNLINELELQNSTFALFISYINVTVLYYRPYWRCYYSNTDANIYVVDYNKNLKQVQVDNDELLFIPDIQIP